MLKGVSHGQMVRELDWFSIPAGND